MAKHRQWVRVSNRTDVGDSLTARPLISVSFDDGEFGCEYVHPMTGDDWTAKVVKIGAHAGDGCYHALVEFRSVPAIDGEDCGELTDKQWEKYRA